MAKLHQELIFTIILYLPTKSIIRFKCVSKYWLRLVTSKLFINIHLDHTITNNIQNIMLRSALPRVHSWHPDFGPSKLYSFSLDCAPRLELVTSLEMDYQKSDTAIESNIILEEMDYPLACPIWELELVGSCNGLVCINPDNDVACLWNPSIREYRRLPDTDIESLDGFYFGGVPIAYGFGYDKVAGDYKVVRIVSQYSEDSDDESYSEVRVYSLGSNEWKRVSNVPYECVNGESGVLASGALHWLVTDWSKENNPIIVVSFDIHNEEFREVKEPEYGCESNAEFVKSLCVHEGKFCLICYRQDVGMDVWVMNDYGVQRPWTKLLKFGQPIVSQSFGYVKLLRDLKISEILVERKGNAFFLFDPKCGRARDFHISGLPSWFSSITYLETLVSLDTITTDGL